MNEIKWVTPLINSCLVIDASPGMSLKKKGPQPAAAMGSGPDSSVGPTGEGKNRSSAKSIARIGAAEQTIFEVFPKVADPPHNPGLLSKWLRAQFPTGK